MPFTTNRISDQPIVICTITSHVDPINDPPASRQRTYELLPDETGPIYRIIDFSQVEVDFTQVMMGLSTDRPPEGDRLRSIMVGTNELVKFAAEAAGQDQYGNQRVLLFTSVEEAIVAAQADLNS